jgi:hypothetical protein
MFNRKRRQLGTETDSCGKLWWEASNVGTAVTTFDDKKLRIQPLDAA